MANKIYASKEISIKDNFKEITGTHFRSESETIDFKNSALAAKSINQWCAEKTNDKIKKIIEPSTYSIDYITQDKPKRFFFLF